MPRPGQSPQARYDELAEILDAHDEEPARFNPPSASAAEEWGRRRMQLIGERIDLRNQYGCS